MAFDAPRKTLDDIRREPDAECEHGAIPDADAAVRLFSAETDVDERHVARLSAPPDPDGTVPALSRFVPPGRVSKPTAVSTRRPATSTPASKSPTRVVEPEAWHKSGREVRAALSAWLLQSRRGDAHAPVSETAVIFSADGRTARTHVPMPFRWRHRRPRAALEA
jgi:hypothetical protein